MFIMMGYYGFHHANFSVSWTIIFLPLLVIIMALLGLGLGLIITAMTTKYRDLTFLITFGIQLLMYTTTVIYPLSSTPEKYKFIINLNPMTGIIEAFRYGLLGQGQPTLNNIGYSLIFTLITLVIGTIVFNKTEKNFVDTI
jgi:lipopolysaccharide transport system permease protein